MISLSVRHLFRPMPWLQQIGPAAKILPILGKKGLNHSFSNSTKLSLCQNIS